MTSFAMPTERGVHGLKAEGNKTEFWQIKSLQYGPFYTVPSLENAVLPG
jgi:hypothetical protein